MKHGDGQVETQCGACGCGRETEVAALRAAVFGNGHPERSLLVRMERVESRLAVIQKLSFATLCGVGTLVVRFVGAWLEGVLRSS